MGAAGTALLTLGFHYHAGYGALVPGLIVSGLGQGVTWTAMFIASATGVEAEHSGVANGMATTTLSLGNAIGLAVLIAVAGRGTAGLTGADAKTALSSGFATAVWITAGLMVVGAVLALAFRPTGRAPAPAVSAADSQATALSEQPVSGH